MQARFYLPPFSSQMSGLEVLFSTSVQHQFPGTRHCWTGNQTHSRDPVQTIVHVSWNEAQRREGIFQKSHSKAVASIQTESPVGLLKNPGPGFSQPWFMCRGKPCLTPTRPSHGTSSSTYRKNSDAASTQKLGQV